LIDNRDQRGEGELLRVVNPATEALIAEFRGTSVAQVDAAVKAAKAAFIRWFADIGTRDWTRNLGFNNTLTAVSSVAYRPVGVVAAISAFNYPILLGGTKLGAALAAGCTMVLLSSPRAPLTILMLGDLVRQAGIPPGVVNILAGGHGGRPGADRASLRRQDQFHWGGQCRQASHATGFVGSARGGAGTRRQIRGHHATGRRLR
jgi:aldehyde dehydrogenase (NAD+)/betaine-aldehyde dehydrogenase